MNSKQWEEVKDRFHEARQLSAEIWQTNLRSCSDEIVRLEVERLLLEASRAGDFLSQPAIGLADGHFYARETSKDNERVDESVPYAGKTVGVYRLIRELGQGGMGAVWLAERTDGILNRPVAIKLPHAGIYGRYFVERFRREREILASLTHPHIGRIYDAGVTEEGEPFLALEYIEGTELIAYCDSKQLGIRERLQLFLQVLSAVHYANSHLVIHRDLKPSNILVDVEGHVKLLDFGIAKLLPDGEANGTELTQIGGRALTTRYASPEQIMSEPISTASDVYSSGVVLFELLTGERPYRPRIESRASLEEAILSGEIVRPSQAATAKKLAAAVKGDLDTILLKALARQPGQRYATADAFSQDIERYLTNQPVFAQAKSVWYWWKKFAWRNRLAVAAMASVILALVIGLTAALWEAQKARRQAETAESVLTFIEGIFKLNSTDEANPAKARQTTVRDLLDIGSTRLDTALKNDPVAKMRLLETISSMYNDLGIWRSEVDIDRKRVKLARSIYSSSDPALADVLLDLADDDANEDLQVEGSQAVQEAVHILNDRRDYTSPLRARLESALANLYLHTDLRQALVHSRSSASLVRTLSPSFDKVNYLQASSYYERESGNYDTAESLAAEAIANAGSDPEMATAIPWMYKHLAEAQEGKEDLENASNNFAKAKDVAQKFNGGHGTWIPLIDFAYQDFLTRTSCISQGIAVAGPAYKEALMLSKNGDTTFLLPDGVITFGNALITFGRIEDGLAVLHEAEKMRVPVAALILNRLYEERANAFIETGRYAEAETLLKEAAKGQRHLGREHAPGYNRNLLLRAHLLNVTGRNEEALETLSQYRLFPVLPDRVSRVKLDEILMRSEIQLSAGNLTLARKLAKDARTAITGSSNRQYLRLWEARAALIEGKAILLSHDAQEALPLLEAAVSLRTELFDAASPALADADIVLSTCYLNLHELKKALALLKKAKAIHAKHAELGQQYRQPLKDLESRLRASRRPESTNLQTSDVYAA